MSIKSSEPLYKCVVEYIHGVWGTKGYFPGPQPISIERRHFPILRDNAYVVCEKTDGLRYMMVALTYEGMRKCVFVNRSFEMFEVPISLRRPAYNGTILDGELYEDTLMVYDAVIVNGQPVGHMNFNDRIDAVRKLLNTIIYVKTDKYRLKLKTFHPLITFKTFMDVYLPTVQQKIDGLVFTPVNEPVKIGTHETMFKWKPCEKNTIDFYMKKGRSFDGIGTPGIPVWKLYVQEKGQLFYESEFPCTRMNEPWFEEGAIVECMYITWENGPLWWKPLLRRRDKTYPNNRRTFYRTLVNIKENIEMKEFLDCIPIDNALHG